MKKIDDAIRSGGWPNASSLARHLDVAPRTIRRDIEYLRHQMGVPVEFDSQRNGYFYSEQSYRLPFFQLTEGDLIALFLAERVLEQYQGTPYAPALARSFAKITAGLDDRITIDLAHLGSLHSFRTTAPVAIDPLIFQELSEAARTHRRVEVDYWTASRDEMTHRAVDPYHLASVDGQWYLIGHCHLRSAIKVFLIARVQSLHVTDTIFEVPSDFRVDAYFSQAFSIIRGDEGELHRVRLRFRGDAVRYVRERIWHSSQVIEESGDRELIVCLTVSHLREVERWALSWAPDCEVLEPDELRQRVAEVLRRGAQQHANSAPRTRKGASHEPKSRRPRRRR
jgi:predicted DNA-binding transcriptional regulator YafY